jgi:N-acetylglutamate synthase-like GNAT family acetyltransferase
VSELSFREGRPGDLQAVFELGEDARGASRRERGLVAAGDEAELHAEWERERPLVKFLAGQSDTSFWVAEEDGELAGYVIVAHFVTMDELVELWVAPAQTGRGIGHALLERVWPRSPSKELGRVVVSLGLPADLTLFTEFGVMPASGHWHMRHRVDQYLEQRAQELDTAEPDVHGLTPERAVDEWKRLEPGAIGHERPLLHEFFGRTRNCLATMDAQTGHASALCWVSSEGEIGPAVGESAGDLVPVLLAAFDRVAKLQEPETVGVFCATDSWWLLDRLRRLGFGVHWPAWIMSSVPLPGLDRYVPTRPPRVL